MTPEHTPLVFLLPDNDSNTPLTILTLPHPRTLVPARFLLHSAEGRLYEITKIVPASSVPRSWLLAPPSQTSSTDTPETTTPGTYKTVERTPVTWLSKGHILSSATMYICTPYDPLFLLLPHLLPAVGTGTEGLYKPMEDIMDSFDEGSEGPDNWGPVLGNGKLRDQMESRIKAVSDEVPGAYRPNTEKAIKILAKKCEAMVEGGLPPSMERAAVGRIIRDPVGVEGVVEGVRDLEVADGAELPRPEPTSEEKAKTEKLESLRRLLRLKTAASFLAGTYLAAHHGEALAKMWDFGELEVWMEERRKERSEAVALRAADFAAPGGGGGGGVPSGERGGGKRRKEEEEKEEKEKKKQVASKAVRDLNKVNTRGMAKMTSFFKKKE